MKAFLLASTLTLVLTTAGSVAQLQPSPKTPIGPGAYALTPNGTYVVETNIAQLWPGVWKETNGLRVQLYCWGPRTPELCVSVAVGSVVSNSWASTYVGPPDGGFLKCELLDAMGSSVPIARGRGVISQLPKRLSVQNLPKWKNGNTFRNYIAFMTNSPPDIIREFKLRDAFKIEKEAEYRLTVCPSIYRFETNGLYVERVDLPCVSTNIHLKPH